MASKGADQPPADAKRVALVTRHYHPSIGGVETRFRAIAETLATRGHQVDVLCIGHLRDLPPVESVEGVEVRRVVRTSLYSRWLHPGLQRHLGRVLRTLGVLLPYALRVHQQLHRGQYDLVLFSQDPIVHVLAAPRSVRRGAAIDWCEIYERGPMAWALRHLPRQVAVNFAITEAGVERLRAQGIDAVYLPSGVHIRRYRSEPEAARSGVLFLGRLYPNKNLPLLVDGWVAHRRAGAADRLVIAGDGPERDTLERLVRGLPAHLRSEVDVLGAVDEDEKLARLASARVLAITSTAEGFPNTVLEAMASGLPVLTVDEPLNGTAGVVASLGVGVVTAPTPDAVASGIREVEARWTECSAIGLERAPEFAWDRIVDRLLSAWC